MNFIAVNFTCISRENVRQGSAVWTENVTDILGWVWHIQALSYFAKVFWALERERDKRRRIHINAITFHHPCLFRWFLSWWRARSNGHISYKLSINVTDVGLTLDCRITHFYGSCGLLYKHNCDGGRPGLNAPSAPTLSQRWLWCSDQISRHQTESWTQISFPFLVGTGGDGGGLLELVCFAGILVRNDCSTFYME